MKTTCNLFISVLLSLAILGCDSEEVGNKNYKIEVSDRSRLTRSDGGEVIEKIKSLDFEMDFYPIVITFRVVDKDSVDILSPDSRKMDIGGITIFAKGEQLAVSDGGAGTTRYYLPRWSGARLDKDAFGRYIVATGEYDGAATYENEQVIIRWPNMQQDTISFDAWNYLDEEKLELHVGRRFYLNGQRLVNGAPTFVLVDK